MNKFRVLVVLLLLTASAGAQDLLSKVPGNAALVVTVKGDKLTELLTLQEWDSTDLVKEILNDKYDEHAVKTKSIKDLGLDFTRSGYFYSVVSDSITFYTVLVPLQNRLQFQNYVSKRYTGNKVQHLNGYNFIEDTLLHKVVAWNNQFALFLDGESNYAFFYDAEKKKQYGLEEYPYNDYPTVDTAMTATAVEVDAAAEAVKEAAVEDVAVEEVTVGEDNEYDRISKRNDFVKDSLINSWTKNYAVQLLNANATVKSIANNDFYKRTAASTAPITVFSNFDVYNKSYSRYGGMMSGLGLGMVNSGYDKMYGDVFFDKEAITFNGSLKFKPDMVDMYKSMFDGKLNKKFFKYANLDDAIGYMSYAVNTESYMKFFPKMMAMYFGVMERDSKPEADMLEEVLGIFIDEKAIAQAANGDALVLFTDITSKEREYMTYDYNDSTFESKEVLKKKTESVPDFVMMFTSKDFSLWNSFLKYGIKKGYLNLENGIYTNKRKRDFDFDFFITYQDGIVFLATDKKDIEQIRNGGIKSSVNKIHRKSIQSNTFTMFFNPKKLTGKFKEEDLNGSRDFRNMYNTITKFGDMKMTSGFNKTGGYDFNATFEMPNQKGNSLRYLLELMNAIEKRKYAAYDEIEVPTVETTDAATTYLNKK